MRSTTIVGGNAVSTVTDHDEAQIERANGSGLRPAVFIHGLWLLPSSWDRWVEVFEGAGLSAMTLGWPDDPETVAEAKEHPEAFAHKTVGQVADHLEGLIGKLDKKPAVIGHSFGGLLAQILAGRGRSKATVAIDPAPFRGVLPLPVSALRSAAPVLGNPANRNRAVPLTYEQFRFGFANAVSEGEARELYDTYAVPASGAPLFQAATPISTRGRKRRSTPRTRGGGRCSSSPVKRTTRSRGPSPTPRSSSSSETAA